MICDYISALKMAVEDYMDAHNNYPKVRLARDMHIAPGTLYKLLNSDFSFHVSVVQEIERWCIKKKINVDSYIKLYRLSGNVKLVK